MNNTDFVSKAKDIAQNYKTLYVMGGWGAPLNAANRDYYSGNNSYNRQTTRAAMIKSATAETFAFDCSGLIKGILWGWKGDKNHKRGGASYTSNNVPDLNADGMIKKCSDVSTDFSNIEIGELLWMSGHVGIYIGNGQAVECTPSWKNGVQITTVKNIKSGTGHKWTKHGKLPYVTYEKPNTNSNAANTANADSNTAQSVSIALNVLRYGAEGAQVKTLQRLLTALNYKMVYNNRTYGVDGEFGNATKGAVESFQAANKLPVTGVVDADTWAKLLKG